MIRPAYPADHGFIINSWLRSYSCSPQALSVTPHDEAHTRACDKCGAKSLRRKEVGGHTRFLAGPTYWSQHKNLISRLVATCNVAVFDTDGMIDGWICREWQRPVLHYVYVRRSARGVGVARELVADLLGANARYTHWRSGVRADRTPPGWRYDPYALTERDE